MRKWKKREKRREERAGENRRKGKRGESWRKGEREECTVKSGRINIFLIDKECRIAFLLVIKSYCSNLRIRRAV